MDLVAKALLCTLGLAGAASASAAQGDGRLDDWYFGLSAGNAWADVSDEQLRQIGSGAMMSGGMNLHSWQASSVDHTDIAWSAFGGFRFARNFAVEVAYIDLGSVEYRETANVGRVGVIIPPPPTSLAAATGEVSFETTGFAVKVLGVVPLGERFDFHANLGVFICETEGRASGSAPSSSWSFNRSASGHAEAGIVGMGAGYRFYGPWTLNLDWQHYEGVSISEEAVRSISFSEDLELDRDTVTLSVLLSF